MSCCYSMVAVVVVAAVALVVAVIVSDTSSDVTVAFPVVKRLPLPLPLPLLRLLLLLREHQNDYYFCSMNNPVLRLQTDYIFTQRALCL